MPHALLESQVHTLTFDDGPSVWTSKILDLLARHDRQATFFVTGQHIVEHAPLLLRMRDEGHQIGNHGFSHRRLTDLDDLTVHVELGETSMLIESVTGQPPTLFRAPYFGTDERVNGIAADLGLTHVGASCVPDDWATDDAEAVARVVLSELRPGAVVSLHDGIPPDGGSQRCTQSRQPTVEAVRLILEGMQA